MLSYKIIGGNLVDKSPEKIQKMFDEISEKYDFLNNLMSFGTQIFIKKDCINQLSVEKPCKILDLCCGTGDLTRILRRKYKYAEVFGVDFSEKMVNAARQLSAAKQLGSYAAKLDNSELPHSQNPDNDLFAHDSELPHEQQTDKNLSTKNDLAAQPPSCLAALSALMTSITYLQADATNLPFEDNSFDIVTIGFGLRNIKDFDGALKEIYRVLKPNGEFLHLDFGEKNIFNKIFDKITPNLIKIFTKNNEAYSYLIQSKQEFFAPDELIKKFENKRFEFVKRKNYLFGSISCQIMKKS